jgi:cytochrome P450 family 110
MQTLPRGPGAIPGTLRFMLDLATSRDLYESFAETAGRYDDPMTMAVPGSRIVVTSDPAGIKAIFTADPDTFVPALGDSLAVFLGAGSLFMMGGEAHKRARKMLAPPFYGERMRAYGALMREVALRWAARWQPGKPFAVLDTTQAITLDVIIEAIFGVQTGERVTRFHESIVSTVAALTPSIATFGALRHNFFGVGPWARFQKRFTTLRDLILEEINGHRASPEGREDILSLILLMRDEAGGALSDQEIIDQPLTMVRAGHETTAVSLSWAFYFLHRNEEALERLRAELKSLGEGPAPDAIARLPYLEAVCQETLRLCPVVAIVTRKLGRPFELKGHLLPEGTLVGAGASLVHYREDLFPEPKRFRPERFLERSFSPFEYIPFGGGARRCLGAAFAMYEMKLVLAAILSRYRLRLCDEGPAPAVLRGATIGPKGGVKMALLT